jgi:hypothetical protein
MSSSSSRVLLGAILGGAADADVIRIGWCGRPSVPDHQGHVVATLGPTGGQRLHRQEALDGQRD